MSHFFESGESIDPIPQESEPDVIEPVVKSRKIGKIGSIIAGVTAVTLGALGEVKNIEAADSRPKTAEVKGESLTPEERERKIASNQLSNNLFLVNNFENKISQAHITDGVKKYIYELNGISDALKVLKDEKVPGLELLQEMTAKGDDDLKKIKIARLKTVKWENETLEKIIKTFNLENEDIRTISDEKFLAKILNISTTNEVESIVEFKLVQGFLSNEKKNIEQCEAFIKLINSIDTTVQAKLISEKLEKIGFGKIDRKSIEDKCSARKSFLLSALDLTKKAAKQRQ
jgi:hypothetical protein